MRRLRRLRRRRRQGRLDGLEWARAARPAGKRMGGRPAGQAGLGGEGGRGPGGPGRRRGGERGGATVVMKQLLRITFLGNLQMEMHICTYSGSKYRQIHADMHWMHECICACIPYKNTVRYMQI